MKILYIAHTNAHDGSCIALMNILKYMKDKCDVRVFLPKPVYDYEGILSDFCKTNGIIYYDDNYYTPYIYIKRRNIIKKIFQDIQTIKNIHVAREAIKKIIDDFKPDIVHTNSGVIDIAQTYCIKKGIPHVWHLREYQDLDFNISVMPSKWLWNKKIHKDGNYNIAITKGIFNYFHLRKCDKVIYDGVIDENRNIQYNVGSPIQGKYFLYVASGLSKKKGALDTFEAFKKFTTYKKGYKLVYVGSTSSDYKLFTTLQMEIKQYGLDKKIIFVGTKEWYEVYNYMHHAEAFLMMSYFEGFGFTTVEAMLNNCFVIGRNTAGTKEQFENGFEMNGKEIGIRVNSVDDAVKAMLFITDEKNKEIVSETKDRAKETVLKLYTISNSVHQLYTFYGEIKSSHQ